MQAVSDGSGSDWAAFEQGLNALVAGMVEPARQNLSTALASGLPPFQDAQCRANLGFCLALLGEHVDENLLGPALQATNRHLRIAAHRTLAIALWNRTGDMSAVTEVLNELGQRVHAPSLERQR
jgi:hypothetical protein